MDNPKSNNHDQMKTTLRAAHSATQAAEERFSLLVESVKDYGIFLLDPHGNILSWNKGAERIKGYRANEVIGKHFSMFYTLPDIKRGHPQNELKIAFQLGKYEEEGWRVRKDGSTFWASVVITALRDKNNDLVGYAKVTRDLTERKDAEDRLKKSEERHRRMFEGIKDYAMIMLDEKGRVASWNEGARRIKGYEAEEIIGQYFSKFYIDQDIQMGKCEYELKEASETGRFEDEGWRLRKDGTKFWASVLITAIRDENGTVIGFSKVTRDITDKKRSNDLLRMAYTNLEKRVEERTNELLRINEELKDAIKARDEFMSIASHELRTPLTPLKLQIQALMTAVRRKSTQHLSEERMEKMAETCNRSIVRLSFLIDDLLDVSRITSGKLTLNLESFDISETAKEIVDRLKPEIDRSESQLTVTTSGTVFGSFDRIRVEQIITNLLKNALKFGNRNPITLDVSDDMGYAKIVVKDLGVGIKDIDKERIFNRFEKVESTVNVDGLGLGLYLSKQIIDAHGGTIEVSSTPTKGSTFVVRLPLNQALH